MPVYDDSIVKQALAHICKQLKELGERPEPTAKPTTIIHKLDFSSWGATITICALLVFVITATGVVVRQHQEIAKLENNDLKYRYVKMLGGINGSDLVELEEFFWQPNAKSSIRTLRKRVETYEEAVRKQAIALERARLAEQESAQQTEKINAIKAK